MTAIIAVTNGVSVEDALHWNQYKDTLSAVLGITDTAQNALGRLVLPQGTAPPASPTIAQAFLDTDELSQGTLKIGMGSPAAMIPYLPIRQIRTTVYNTGNVGVGAGDTNVLSDTIVTTGGLVLILANIPLSAVPGGTGTIQLIGFLKRGSTNLERHAAVYYGANASGQLAVDHSFNTIDNPGAAGSYTYNLGGVCVTGSTNATSGNSEGAGSDAVPRARMTLIEIGTRP